jgi:bidirectional [NiFe] hydrogenase diaphorase subunit
MVTIVIDGHKVKAKENSTILENTQELNIDIPTLCFHRDLSSFGACRLCTVEVKTNGKWELTASCDTPVEQGMEIRTNSDKVRESRKLAAELLYYRYPTTEVIREVARKLAVQAPEEKGEGHDCILCGLCVRTCREIVGVSALAYQDRGHGRDIDEPRIEFNPNTCIGCGSCAYVCPTGYVQMESIGDKRIIWNKVFTMMACTVCGRLFAPEDQLRYISEHTSVPFERLAVCIDCR